MSQVAIKTLTTEWVDFNTVQTPSADTLYYIQNRGPNAMLAQESDSVPTTEEGIVVPPYSVLKYKLGSQTLYLKSLNGTCTINISEVG